MLHKTARHELPKTSLRVSPNSNLTEALSNLDVQVDLCLSGQFVDTPPVSPEDGAAYLIGASPSDAWADHALEIATKTGVGWLFSKPVDGLRAYFKPTGAFLIYTDGNWTDCGSLNGAQEISLTAAETCDLAAANSSFVQIVGNATIASFGGGKWGWRLVRYAGANTILNNNSIILKNAPCRRTAAGDWQLLRKIGNTVYEVFYAQNDLSASPASIRSMADLTGLTAAQMAAYGCVCLGGYYPESPAGGGLFVWFDADKVAASFTGTIAGNWLTVTDLSGLLKVGQIVSWPGGPSDLRITQIASLSAGIYRLSQSLTVATPTAMTASIVIDNGYAVAPSDHPNTSAYGCMLRVIDVPSDLAAEDFGARAGVTDQDQAPYIQNGIDCIARLGGGRLKLGSTRYHVSSVRISDTSVGLIGQGHGGNNPGWGDQKAATAFLHYGNTPDAMVLVQPKSTDTIALQNNSVEGIFFEGNGTAAYGLLAKSVCNGNYDINGHSLRKAVAMFTVISSSEGTISPADTQGNTITAYGDQSGLTLSGDDTGYILGFDGFYDAANPNLGANASHCTVMQVSGRHKDGHAVYFGNCDNILVIHFNLFRIPGGTGNAIRFKRGVFGTTARGNMLLWGIEGPGGIYCEGTTTDPNILGSGPNILQWRDFGNAPPVPVIEDGAVFYYAENQYPNNCRRWQSTADAVRLSSVTMDHVVHNAGYCFVAANSTATVEFPSNFHNCGIIVKAICTPTDVPVSGYKITADGATVSITNTDATRSAVFWWEVDALARPPVPDVNG
jgi:hypothetical protein